MALGEIYVKLAVTFADDPKVRALARYGADANLARDLYVQMILHCKRLLTDGFVPAEQIGLLVYPLDMEHGNQLAKQLASVGLIKEVSNAEANDKQDQAQGWQVCAYLKRNGTREDVEKLSQVRAEAGRAGGAKSRKRPAPGTAQASRKQVAKQNVSRSTPKTESVTDTGKDLQAPTAPAAAAAGESTLLTITQRSKRLTDAYAEAEPMCKWPAVNGVVISAIKSGRFADDEIRAALLRLAAEGRSVTVDTLRTELQGLPPGQQPKRGHQPYRNPTDPDAYTMGFTDD